MKNKNFNNIIKRYRGLITGIFLIIIGVAALIILSNNTSESDSGESSGIISEYTELPEDSGIIHADNQNFDGIISNDLSLVDFWADWCPPCRLQNPILKELAKDLDGKATIIKVNVDYNSQLASRFNIRSIPTLILFKDGVPVERLTGLQQKDDLKKIIYKHL